MPTLRIILTVILVVVIGYGFMEAIPLISGPSLAIATPKKDALTKNGIVTVSGRVKRAVRLTLNGGTLLPTSDGTFSKTLALPRGEAILTLKVADRFGHTVTDTRSIFVQ